MDRLGFIKKLALGGCLAWDTAAGFADALLTSKSSTVSVERIPEWPLPDIAREISVPVLIRSIELVKTQGELLLVVCAQDGSRGVTQCNDRMPHLISLLKGLVIPHFLAKDARQLPQLVDNAYRLNSNYKYAGMPLWNCIGSIEIAIWDMLGRIANKPVHRLLGKAVRGEYDIYISDFYRGEGPVEQVVENLALKLKATGATGIKIKVGGRMANSADDERRTRVFVPMLRKRLGDQVTIYADGNGSFTADQGIETGKFLQDYGVDIFEEPCNFEDEDATFAVSRALTKLKLAGGEQDSSIFRFDRLAQKGVYDIFQPDLYYNGGILRTLQVCEIARVHGRKVAPHTPKADPLIAPFWQVAALAKNLYGLQEFVYNPAERHPAWYTPVVQPQNGKVRIPGTPGLGIDYDASIWKEAVRVL